MLEEGLKPQLFSTAHDLKKLWSALVQGEFLRTDTVRLLLAPYQERTDSPKLYVVEGQAPGAHVFFGGAPDATRFVTVLSNGEEAVRSLFDQLIKMTHGGR